MDTLIKLNDDEINYLIENIYRTKKLIDTFGKLVDGLEVIEIAGDLVRKVEVNER